MMLCDGCSTCFRRGALTVPGTPPVSLAQLNRVCQGSPVWRPCVSREVVSKSAGAHTSGVSSHCGARNPSTCASDNAARSVPGTTWRQDADARDTM